MSEILPEYLQDKFGKAAAEEEIQRLQKELAEKDKRIAELDYKIMTMNQISNETDKWMASAKTLRDEFAMSALTGLIRSRGDVIVPDAKTTAQRAGEYADAAMKEREKGREGR